MGILSAKMLVFLLAFVAVTYAACNSTNCNGHGTCEGSVCKCNLGFAGPDCAFACKMLPKELNNCRVCVAQETCSWCESDKKCAPFAFEGSVQTRGCAKSINVPGLCPNATSAQ